MSDQHSRPPTRMCIMCGTTEGLLNHHVNYCTDETVTLCGSCHGQVHADENHILYPVDGDRADLMVDVQVDQEVKDDVARYGSINDSWNDALRNVLAAVDRLPVHVGSRQGIDRAVDHLIDDGTEPDDA